MRVVSLCTTTVLSYHMKFTLSQGKSYGLPVKTVQVFSFFLMDGVVPYGLAFAGLQKEKTDFLLATGAKGNP